MEVVLLCFSWHQRPVRLPLHGIRYSQQADWLGLLWRTVRVYAHGRSQPALGSIQHQQRLWSEYLSWPPVIIKWYNTWFGVFTYPVPVLQLASQHIQRLQNTHLFQFDRSPSEPHPLATSSWIYMYMYCKLNIKSVQTVFECVHGYWRKRYINGIVNDFRRNWTLWKLLSIKRWASVTSGIDQLWVSLLRHRKQPVVLSCS